MDIHEAIDILFLRMVVGACMAVAVLRKRRDGQQDGKDKVTGADSGTPKERNSK